MHPCLTAATAAAHLCRTCCVHVLCSMQLVLQAAAIATLMQCWCLCTPATCLWCLSSCQGCQRSPQAVVRKLQQQPRTQSAGSQHQQSGRTPPGAPCLLRTQHPVQKVASSPSWSMLWSHDGQHTAQRQRCRLEATIGAPIGGRPAPALPGFSHLPMHSWLRPGPTTQGCSWLRTQPCADTCTARNLACCCVKPQSTHQARAPDRACLQNW
jgi:hypothetical protein